MNKHLNLRSFTLIGILANFCFILFIFLGFAYYLMWEYAGSDTLVTVGEIGIKPFEILGFVAMAIQTSGYIILIRGNKTFRTLQAAFFLVELVLMLFDFRIIDVSFYDGRNAVLVILHMLFSVLFIGSFSMINNNNEKLRKAIYIAVSIAIFSPVLFWALFSFQVYFSMLADCIALLVIYSVMYFEMLKEELWVDAIDFGEDE